MQTQTSEQAVAESISFSGMVMIGLSMFGDVVATDPKRRGNALVQILTGRYEKELMAVSFYQAHRRNPNDGEDYLKDATAKDHYERVVGYCRNVVQGIFNRAENDLMLQKQAEFANLREQLAQTNKPHPKGTVSELATKLGKTKNEIRRMKLDGTLDAAIEAAGI